MSSPTPNDPSGGWNASAEAWVLFVDEGDVNRTHLLDPVMLDWCGDVRGRRVLDVGCGEGRFCRMLAERGAQVAGIDSTLHLVETARQRDTRSNYHIGDAAQLPFPDASFDLCITYITLVDIVDYRHAIAEMARVLKPGGRVLLANLQPYVTANTGGWAKDAQGRKLNFPIDNYMTERAVIGRWRGIEVTQHHRPLGAIMQAFLDVELVLRRFNEPVATAEAQRAHPILEEDARVPIFVVMEWDKPEA